MLNIARGWTAVGNTEKAISFGNQALAMANKSGYRYYAMRSRHLLSTLVIDESNECDISRCQLTGSISRIIPPKWMLNPSWRVTGLVLMSPSSSSTPPTPGNTLNRMNSRIDRLRRKCDGIKPAAQLTGRSC